MVMIPARKRHYLTDKLKIKLTVTDGCIISKGVFQKRFLHPEPLCIIFQIHLDGNIIFPFAAKNTVRCLPLHRLK